MPTITDPAAFDALQAKGCLLPDSTVDRDTVAALVAAEMEANHVAHSEADIGAAAVAPAVLASTIFAVDSVELAKLVGGLLGLSEKGKVHVSLSDGLAVCGIRTKMSVEVVPGQWRSFSLATRFLSADGDIIEKHRLEGFAKRARSAARTAHRVAADVTTRQPEMADRINEWTAQVQLSFQRELTGGSGS
jgi:hypothetical protein